MLSPAYKIVINRGVGSPGNGKYVVDGLNVTDKRFVSMLMATAQIPGVGTDDSQMAKHTSMSITEICLAREFQNTFKPNMCI